MKFFVVSVFPEMITQALSYGVVGQAIRRGNLHVHCFNPRKFAGDVHQSVDDRPYGGGDGMVMMAEPLAKSVDEIRSLGTQGPVIYLSPKGRVLNDSLVRDLVLEPDITLVCGRYGGVDERFIAAHVDLEISLGDFILSGGEVAALAVVDAVARQVPGVLGNEVSFKEESFAEGLLEFPQFTRPRVYNQIPVPEVLLGGNHGQIQHWRKMSALALTLAYRPDLVSTISDSLQEKPFLDWVESLSEGEWHACGLSGWSRAEIKERLKHATS